jgi:hypothetical protein
MPLKRLRPTKPEKPLRRRLKRSCHPRAQGQLLFRLQSLLETLDRKELSIWRADIRDKNRIAVW